MTKPSAMDPSEPRPAVSESLPRLTLPLGSAEADLASAGGKAASLARLVEAGLPVPDGFIVGTDAYRSFVQANDLQAIIDAAVSEIDGRDPKRLDQASEAIRIAFAQATMPQDIAAAIAAAYARLAGESSSVAVRSSATAEDLPDLSFAGQQETYLNIRGESAVLAAVQRCWASLWTPRAIGYRAQHAVPTDGVAMAVVVQGLIPAESAGILFTANPITGDRDQAVINASWGLGEAIVGGLVTPDTVIVNKKDGSVVSRETANKAVMTVRTTTGSAEQEVPPELRERAVLDDAAAAELVSLAGRIETHFGQAMDIEWAFASGRFYILQARPITALPEPSASPPPTVAVPDTVEWIPPIEGSAWLRRQVVEHMPEPLSPLFAELYLERGLEHSMHEVMDIMGMPQDVLQRFFDPPMFNTVNGFAYMRADFKLNIRSFGLIFAIYLKVLPRLLRVAIPYWRDEQLPAYQEKIERWKRLDLPEAEDAQLLEGLLELADADAVYWFAANFPLALSKVTDGLLGWVLRSVKPARNAQDTTLDYPLSSGPLLRGYPSKTLDAQIALEAVARMIGEDEPLRARLLDGPARELMRRLEASPSGGPALAALQDYLALYGHQIYNLDFVVPTQAEDPLPVLIGLHALLAHPERDAVAMQRDFAEAREETAAAILLRLGPIRRPIFRKTLAWAQRFTPYREDALYYVGAAWPTLRGLALELGGRMVAAGLLAQPDDVFYLRSADLRQAIAERAAGTVGTNGIADTAGIAGTASSASTAGTDRGQLSAEASKQRALRNERLGLQPPPTVPENYRMKIGPFDLSSSLQPKENRSDGEAIEGYAVSPGRVTAPASVILSPADFEKMRPDTILVCPTTTPAWTPLFAQARGLVTDIGGVLAHGSIVAREYGIPAVMGTTVATTRIRDGQMITVDGTAGTVVIVE
jgi:pyruvate,water dikinase